MLIIKHTISTPASPESIWRIWEDVEHWNTWDPGIEFSSLDGPFTEGTKGVLKPKGGPLVRTELTCVVPLKKFIDESRLPLTRIVVSHFLTKQEGKTFVTHEIEMHGLLAFFFAIVIGRNMKKNLPTEMAAMVKKAEEYERRRLAQN